MRLLYAIDSLAAGGAERSLAALATAYPALGIELEVVALAEREGVQEDLLAAGARLTSLEGTGGRWARVARLTELIRDRRPALVHTTLFEADVVGRIAARRAHVPVVSSLVNTAYGPEHLQDPGVRRSRLRAAQLTDAITCRLTARMHAVSTFVADTMSARLRYPRDRVDVIPRGRDPEQLGTRTSERRAAARARLAIDDSTPLVVAVARHEHQKGLDVLLEATPLVAARVPSVRVVVAGREGGQSRDLRDRARGLGIEARVELLGARDDVADLLSAADAFVLPSRREGLPGAVIEAMALEAPIVASHLPQVREVVDESMAVLVTVDESDTLATAIADVLTDRAGARERAVRAHERFLTDFTIDRVAARMADFYRGVLTQMGGH